MFVEYILAEDIISFTSSENLGMHKKYIREDA